jgi:hypothetical protein
MSTEDFWDVSSDENVYGLFSSMSSSDDIKKARAQIESNESIRSFGRRVLASTRESSREKIRPTSANMLGVKSFDRHLVQRELVYVQFLLI